MTLPKNKWLLLAAIWFAAGIYGLVFYESNSRTPPPFPHFDKCEHALLFFAQIWLAAKAWLVERQRIPYAALAIFALSYAIGSELAQHFFTATREGDPFDVLADLCGTATALHIAHKTSLHQQRNSL